MILKGDKSATINFIKGQLSESPNKKKENDALHVDTLSILWCMGALYFLVDIVEFLCF